MKKLLLISTLALVSVAPALAQSSGFYKTPYKTRNSGSFHKGENLLTFTYGFPTAFAHDNSGFGPIYAKYERGIIDEIGIGVQLGFGGSNYNVGNMYKVKEFGVGWAVMGFYHFNKLIPVKDLDVYAGVGVSFLNVSRNIDANNGNINHNVKNTFDVNATWKVGARYYFTPKFGVNADFGYDQMSSANIGVTFRL